MPLASSRKPLMPQSRSARPTLGNEPLPRRRNRLALLCLLFAFPAGAEERSPVPPELPAVVDEVEVNGLWKTQRFVVLRELPWTPGTEVSPEAWALGIERLWNAGIFSRVRARLEVREGRRVAVFDLEDRWTINLLLRFGATGDSAWLRVGLYDLNMLGRYFELGGLYERFGRFDGGQFWVRDPRLFGRRLDGTLTLDRLTRPRVGFAVTRTRAAADLLAEVDDRLRVGGRLEAMEDDYKPSFETKNPVWGAISRTTVATGVIRVGVVNTVRLRQHGWSLELRPGVGLTDVPGAGAFGQLFAEALGFASLGQRWNLCLRSQAGAITGTQPQHHFYFGSLDTLRGYPDNFIATRAFAAANLEVRLVAFDSTWFAVMPIAFADGVTGRPEGDSPAGAFAAGVGVRFIIPRIVRSVLRIDWAFPLLPARDSAVVIGSQHLF